MSNQKFTEKEHKENIQSTETAEEVSSSCTQHAGVLKFVIGLAKAIINLAHMLWHVLRKGDK